VGASLLVYYGCVGRGVFRVASPSRARLGCVVSTTAWQVHRVLASTRWCDAAPAWAALLVIMLHARVACCGVCCGVFVWGVGALDGLVCHAKTDIRLLGGFGAAGSRVAAMPCAALLVPGLAAGAAFSHALLQAAHTIPMSLLQPVCSADTVQECKSWWQAVCCHRVLGVLGGCFCCVSNNRGDFVRQLRANGQQSQPVAGPAVGLSLLCPS
jgi:hypothetical protein